MYQSVLYKLTPPEEHVQLLFSQGQELMNSSISHYKMILRGIFDSNPIIPQTSTDLSGQPITSLTSNYLCLQCPTTVSEDDRLKHGNKKSHRFCTSYEGSVLPSKRLATNYH